MTRRRTLVASALLVLVATGALVVHFNGQSVPTPNPPGTFAFAALGDAPYFISEEFRFRFVLRAVDASDLRWVLHVGDIFWRPCTDDHYRHTRAALDGLAHPVIYTPGDNEWADCWESGSGGFVPLERLARLRQIFFNPPEVSLGRRRVTLVTQAARPGFSEFVENRRWADQGLVIATVHLVGSLNALKGFPGRSAADDAASKRRTEAAAAWVHETFAEAIATKASAVVIGFHGSVPFDAPPHNKERQAYEPFLTVLAEDVERFGKPVLAIHGDDHEYTVDHPLTSLTRQPLEAFTRLEVPGSSDVGWVRVIVHPGATVSFAFDPHVVPWWKWW